MAQQWFSTALQWKPEDEPSAYGLALTYQELNNLAEVRRLQGQWGNQSQRILEIGRPTAQAGRYRCRNRSHDTCARTASISRNDHRTAHGLAASDRHRLRDFAAAPSGRRSGCAPVRPLLCKPQSGRAFCAECSPARLVSDGGQSACRGGEKPSPRRSRTAIRRFAAMRPMGRALPIFAWV